tara:strand:- start:158 stop:496 length:339 start_codon:yes stop_codon:yes gene_type:complete
MKINMALTEDKKGLQVTIILPERNLATDEIIVKSMREVMSMVEEKYPEYEFQSGPRKVSNNTSAKLSATWAFVMKPTVKTRPLQKKSPTPAAKKKPTAKKATPPRKKTPNND